MVIKVGMIGFSVGNGHPYSFSSIINGYDKKAFEQSDWLPILNYLESQPKNEIGMDIAKVTHAWSQDVAITNQICKCANIPYSPSSYFDFLGEVDAVIIARDDYQSHLEIGKTFLEYGIPVFIDKPLTICPLEIQYFEPYLRSGLLMSSSGFRYAKELDVLRNRPDTLGKIKRIDAVVVNDMYKYGVHMLDAISGLGLGRFKSIMKLPAPSSSYLIELESGIPIYLSCLGEVKKTFHLHFQL
jgi:hypothetical protein